LEVRTTWSASVAARVFLALIDRCESLRIDIIGIEVFKIIDIGPPSKAMLLEVAISPGHGYKWARRLVQSYLRKRRIIALRWRDMDLVLKQANVTHSVWRNVEGDTKTEASRKPVPLPTLVVEELKKWRKASFYRSDDDFLFPSIAKNGTQPISPDMILRRHIRPALERIGVTKKIGWHSLRHGLATMLRQQGVDLKTAQELLRHANSRITLEIYQQAVGEEKRIAQDLAVRGLLEGGSTQHPSAPSEAA
jgi:integrase